jgi:hypothetical protein
MNHTDSDRRNREPEKFERRKVTLVNKAFELAILCNSNVYILIEHEQRYYAFNSVEDGSWPPSDHSLVIHLSLPIPKNGNDQNP